MALGGKLLRAQLGTAAARGPLMAQQSEMQLLQQRLAQQFDMQKMTQQMQMQQQNQRGNMLTQAMLGSSTDPATLGGLGLPPSAAGDLARSNAAQMQFHEAQARSAQSTAAFQEDTYAARVAQEWQDLELGDMNLQIMATRHGLDQAQLQIITETMDSVIAVKKMEPVIMALQRDGMISQQEWDSRIRPLQESAEVMQLRLMMLQGKNADADLILKDLQAAKINAEILQMEMGGGYTPADRARIVSLAQDRLMRYEQANSSFAPALEEAWGANNRAHWELLGGQMGLTGEELRMWNKAWDSRSGTWSPFDEFGPDQALEHVGFSMDWARSQWLQSKGTSPELARAAQYTINSLMAPGYMNMPMGPGGQTQVPTPQGPAQMPNYPGINASPGAMPGQGMGGGGDILGMLQQAIQGGQVPPEMMAALAQMLIQAQSGPQE